MSYNCDKFIIKKIENLKIPVESLYKNLSADWHPMCSIYRTNNESRTVDFKFAGQTYIQGIIAVDIRRKKYILLCQFVDCSGEGSGFFMNEILEPALKDSTGELVASCVWEGGDSINRLIVKNGDVSWEDIKL